METLLLISLIVWGFTRYAGTELMATARGTDPPRVRERREREARAHERAMSKRAQRTGPSIGEALASRIADRISNPRGAKEPGPARQAMGEWWGDSWGYATDRRRRRHERHATGNLRRQRAARAFRNWWEGKRDSKRQDEPSGRRWADAEVVDDPSDQPEDDIVDAEIVEDDPTGADPGRGKDTDPTEPTDTEPAATPDEQPQAPEPTATEEPPEPERTATEEPDTPAEPAEPDADTTRPDPGTATIHPIRKDPPMTSATADLTSGETLDPTAAHSFASQMATLGQQMHSQLELSVSSLESRGVTGEPIDHLRQMQENASTFAASAESAKAHFARHMNTQDVVTSDSTIAGTVKDTYLGTVS